MLFSKRRACCCGEECNAIRCCYTCEGCPFSLCGCFNADECPEVSPWNCDCAYSGSYTPNGPSLECGPCVVGFGSGICDCEDVDNFGTFLYYDKKCVTCKYYDTDEAGGNPFNITAGTPLLKDEICSVANPGITDGTNFGNPIFGGGGTWEGWENGTGNFVSPDLPPCPEFHPDFGTGEENYPLAEVIYCGCTGCTIGGPGPTAEFNEVIYDMIGVDRCLE